MTKKRDALLEKIRKLCLSFPEVNERESHGNPTFFIRDKRSFLNLVATYYYDPAGRSAIICASPEGVQSSLVETDPELYFLPKYVAKQGWIGMWLDRDTPWATIASIVGAAYETCAEKLAPKKRAAKKSTAKKSPAKKRR